MAAFCRRHHIRELSLFGSVPREDFSASSDVDENLRLALTHLLQTIGEAARKVSAAGRARWPDLPRNAITGMRHRIVHDYMDVDEEVVWKTATGRMEELIAALERHPP